MLPSCKGKRISCTTLTLSFEHQFLYVCNGDAWICIVKIMDMVGKAYLICTVVNSYSHIRVEAFTMTECSAVFKDIQLRECEVYIQF